jgi:5-methylcytosine-specific restriction endonuclease McrA
VKDYARKFYESKSWRDCREGYLISCQYICERCGGIAVIVHHKKRITPGNIGDAFVALSHDNLEALCQDCHNKEHGRERRGNDSVLPYRFGADGEIVLIPPIAE